MKLLAQSGSRSLTHASRVRKATLISLKACTEHSTKLERLKLSKDQNTIYYAKDGDENSYLCFIALHGGPGSHKDFRHMTTPFAEILGKKGYNQVYKDQLSYQLLRFDLPGYGRSDRMSSPPTATNFADQILSVIEAMQLIEQKKKIVLMGHSLGGHTCPSSSLYVVAFFYYFCSIHMFVFFAMKDKSIEFM